MGPQVWGYMDQEGPWGLFGALFCLGPIWGPLGTHLEAEGRHFGGRRLTFWGSGGGAPRNFEFWPIFDTH